jgi:radical SAM/Cys-rich protein
MNDNCDTQLKNLAAIESIKPFTGRLQEINAYPLRTNPKLNTMQVNVGKVCNQACRHCHVGAGPNRTESMSQNTMSECLRLLAEYPFQVLDITGGAPEMNPNLPWFIDEATKLGRHVMVRCNLTVLDLPEYAPLAEFYANHKVEIVSSLPYYSEKDTDRQRGAGVFNTSIKILKRLNDLGYGQENNDLQLNLVYNPGGAFLPPAQSAIEADFRTVLLHQYGIRFNKLFNITNVPIGRFQTFLIESNNLDRYMERLANSFNPATVEAVMCRNQISVGWDGQVYDCDFNQVLGLACTPNNIRDFTTENLRERMILLHNHCYACTAGAGSSCGGEVV